jgi:hypothetical protein
MATARAVAREALARVEAELTAASTPAETEKLRRKKELIRQAMERLDGGTGD